MDTTTIGQEVTGGLVLMAYDYHWGCSDTHAGPNTPMIGNHGMCADGGCNVNNSVSVALDTLGVPPSNLLLGIAWYGREYPTTSSQYCGQTLCNASADDQRDKAYQAPLAAKRAAKYGRRWDASTLTPWYVFQDLKRAWLWWQGYYEDAESVVYKYALARSRRLKGVLIWQLNGCTQGEAPQNDLDDVIVMTEQLDTLQRLHALMEGLDANAGADTLHDAVNAMWKLSLQL